MNEQLANETIRKLTAPILEKGFTFEYLYQKGGDSSCVYICRYKKGKDFFDWREVSGGDEINFVTFVNGTYGFPNMKARFPKQHRAFALKHLFKKATMDEKRAFYAGLFCEAINSGKSDFFGIPL
ncbi:MAG: hypothetical protein IJX87_02430 [Clostridia bacterium]|nr:hypothetical protein [Clostridia bacterium]